MIMMTNRLITNGGPKFFGFLCRRSMVDVTLSAGGEFLQAHRVILAAASTYFEVWLNTSDLFSSFQNLFETLSSEKSPIIFLKDFTYFQLQQVIEYIYAGEVSIAESQLQGFENLLQSLGIPIERSPANPETSSSRSVIIGDDMFVIENVVQNQRNLFGGGLMGPIYSPITEQSRPMVNNTLAGPSSLNSNISQEMSDRRIVSQRNGRSYYVHSTSPQQNPEGIYINSNRTSSSTPTMTPEISWDRRILTKSNVSTLSTSTFKNLLIRRNTINSYADTSNQTTQSGRVIMKPRTEASLIPPSPTMAAKAHQKTPDNRIKIKRYSQKPSAKSSLLSVFNQYTNRQSQSQSPQYKFKCRSCVQAFKCKTSRHCHQLQCSGTKPQCPVCKKFFCNQNYVKIHAKKKHDFNMETL